jgi:hypothetical protein
MRCFPRDEPCYWIRLTKGPQSGNIIRIPLRIAKAFLSYPDKNEFVCKLRDLFNLQHAPATFYAPAYVNLENYFETPYQYLFPDDPTHPLPEPSYTPESLLQHKNSDTNIDESATMHYHIEDYKSWVYEWQVGYTKNGTPSLYYLIQVYFDWVLDNWVTYHESTDVTVTTIGTAGPTLQITVTTSEAGVAFDDVPPGLIVSPPATFLSASVQHTLAAADDYRCEVTLEYPYQLYYDRQYSIQILWNVPATATTAEQKGTVTAIVKWDATVTPATWTVSTGDALFPAVLIPNADLKIIAVKVNRTGTVPSGFTFDDVDAKVTVDQLMAQDCQDRRTRFSPKLFF